jgi:uncharacterized membrane protein YvlD (DUF360 family)
MRRAFGSRRVLVRLLVMWILSALALRILGALLPAVDVGGWRSALAASALIGIFNAILWPLFVRFALPVTVLTLGFAGVVVNGILVWAVSELVDGFVIDSLWWGIALTVGLTIINTATTSLLAIDDDDFYYRNVIRRQARRRGVQESDIPAVVFLEIDGLAYDVLQRAVRDGNAPTLSRWLREGSHHLVRWECDWSSQTGAAQTGLLLGSNENIPAFRWWDKERGAPVSSSALRDVMAIEQELSTGTGLLHADGASRANMYSGDAPHSLLTISTVMKKREGRIGEDYFAYFANPYSIFRTIVLGVADVCSELWGQTQQKRLDIQPRVHRGWFPYPLMRMWMVIVQRDLQVSSVIGDIYAGRPVVYTTFSGYDEMAHHAGIERFETLKVLRRIDREFARLERAAEEAPRPVRFVVLSDHGQTQGETFLQRYGITLEQFVTELCSAESVEAEEQGSEGLVYLSASLTEASHAPGAIAGGVRAATRNKRVDGAVVVGAERETQKGHAGEDKPLPELSIMASGCLGLISFPRIPGRATLEEVSEKYPRLIPELREHPGVGFVFIRSAEDGPVVLGSSGAHYLDSERIEGEDPLLPFGETAKAHIKRTDGFRNCPDIMVNSTYWPETGEVAAFEELCGSHGGMGGTQMFPFVLVPSGVSLPDEHVVGPGGLHRWLRRWLIELGHDGYGDQLD